MLVRSIVTASLLLAARVEADGGAGRTEGHIPIDEPLKGPTRATPPPKSQTQNPTTQDSTTDRSTDTDPGTDDSDALSDTSGWSNPRGHWDPPATRTVRGAPQQVQPYFRLYSGGYIPFVTSAARTITEPDHSFHRSALDQLVGMALAPPHSVPYGTRVDPHVPLPNTPERLGAIGGAIANQQVNARAKSHQGIINGVLNKVVELAGTMLDPSQNVDGHQAIVEAFGHKGLLEWEAWMARLRGAPAGPHETDHE